MYGVYPFCGRKKGLRLPLAVGKGSETPSFPSSEHEERGSLRPFSLLQEGVSDPFSHRKRENPVHPQISLAKIPLAQRIIKTHLISLQELQELADIAGRNQFSLTCHLPLACSYDMTTPTSKWKWFDPS